MEVLTLAAQAGPELAADREHQAELRRRIATGRQVGIPAAALLLTATINGLSSYK